ncbi:hypothetical protein GF374_01940, partial [Candidatus Woesearchaeota archaeon]|nr:hypothetical protein [Candidatus Woesearchaeota archaeon]
MKKIVYAIPILLIILIGLVTYGWFTKNESTDSNIPDLEYLPGNAYEFKPDSLSKDWELVSEKVRLGEFNLADRKKFYEDNISDIAVWEYAYGDERLYVWVKVFETEQDAQEAANVFHSFLGWKKIKTNLAFADDGAVGVWSNLRDNPPLFLYLVEDDTLVHIAYYN